MKVLGVSFIRNAEPQLPAMLDSMTTYCDAIYAVDDRSTDGTSEILHRHPAVRNVITIQPEISPDPWYFSESWLLALLYRMADIYQPHWIVALSADERLLSTESVRNLLSTAAPETAGFQIPLSSAWNDMQYHFMVPLMGQARSLVGRIWRYYPGLVPGGKRLHNSYLPANIANFGRVDYSSDLTIAHLGWSTLAERIAKVDFYTALDPNLELNDGIPYDVGLLFGYRRHQIDELIREYERRVRAIRVAPL